MTDVTFPGYLIPNPLTSHAILISLHADPHHTCRTCTRSGRDLAAHGAELPALVEAHHAGEPLPAGTTLVWTGHVCTVCGVKAHRDRVTACGCGALFCISCGIGDRCLGCMESGAAAGDGTY